jgi:hypothetical protein
VSSADRADVKGEDHRGRVFSKDVAGKTVPRRKRKAVAGVSSGWNSTNASVIPAPACAVLDS